MILYLILSHRNPEQIARLARRLTAAGDAVAVIHHDANVAALPDPGDARIRLVEPRLPVRWGDFSLVAATLHSFEWIARQRIDFDWLVLLSGQDYPVTPPQTLHEFLDASGAHAFVDTEPPGSRFARDSSDRYEFAYVQLPEALRPVVSRLWRLNRLQPWFRFVAMRSGCFAGAASTVLSRAGLTCHRGSTWMTLQRSCVDYVREYAAAHPEVVKHYSRTIIPDESFFQTLLTSSGRFQIVNDNLSYIDWPSDYAGSPRTLVSGDYEALLASGKRFARKFDVEVDAGPLDRLDALQPGAVRQPVV